MNWIGKHPWLSGFSLIILFITFWFTFFPPWYRELDCTPEELLREQALGFAKEYLVDEGYNKSDVANLRIISFSQLPTDYPSFQFELRGIINGFDTRFVGFGNGCGIEDIFDYGTPLYNNPTKKTD